MASRQHPAPQDSTGSSSLAQFPAQLSHNSSLLASVISLPERPLISYAVFTPEGSRNSPESLRIVELARRYIVQENKSRSLLSCLLPSVLVTRDTSTLFLFNVGSSEIEPGRNQSLAKLRLEGLQLSELSSFTPIGLYPCSAVCSARPTPCPTCLNLGTPSPCTPDTQATPTGGRSSARLFPRRPLRRLYAQFLQAVQDRLIDDIVEASKHADSTGQARPAVRLKAGFLLGPPPILSEWGNGWEHYTRQRPLVHCHLQIYLSVISPSSAKLIVHPVLRPTHYLPLHGPPYTPPGTPITLLPHGVPAYFLNSYSGPSAALTSQFDTALIGLGAGGWKHSSGNPSHLSSSSGGPSYIIAWVSVQNKQGEDKGIPIIWPTSLALSFIPGAPSMHARTPLKSLPELPAQLQASPPPPPVQVPANLLPVDPILSAESTSPDTAASPTAGSPHPAPFLVSGPADANLLGSSLTKRTSPRPSPQPSLCHSPTSDSLRAFRTLSLASSSRNIRKVAAEVSGYVEAVAREREKERERIKRERENLSKGLNASNPMARPSGSVKTTAIPIPTVPVQKEVHPAPAVVEQPPLLNQGTSGDTESVTAKSKDAAGPALPTPDEPSSIPTAPVAELVPEVETGSAENIEAGPSASTIAAPPDPLSSSFDPFGHFDSGWTQPANDFSSMNIDYDVGFNMGMSSVGAGRSDAGGGAVGFDMDDGFEFTDDDFNFFDGPSASSRATAAPSMIVSNSLASGLPPLAGHTLGLMAPLLGQGVPSSGPGPPPPTNTSPWVSHHMDEGFTPASIGHFDGVPPAPELLPPSPTRTPSTHSAPVTPSAEPGITPEDGPQTLQMGLRPSVFDPLQFTPSHRLADGKYAFGKFALPSPPDEEDRTVTMFDRSSPSPSPYLSRWKFRYNEATDPRIGVVRRLIGVKRKQRTQGGRESKRSTWAKEHEEWENSSPMADDNAEGARSDSEDEEMWIEEDNVQSIARPVTPPPSYLPLGPTLLQTHFHHTHLLPLSVPLRPPGAAVSPPSASGPMSVPTPVSPAAVLGAASEKTKALEAASQILVKEMVENSAWADAWRANATASVLPTKPPTEICQADVKRVEKLLKESDVMHSPADIKTIFFGDQSPEKNASLLIQPLDSPMLSIGKADTIIQLLPPALRFWEKLGLNPRGGRKDVTAYVFYEDTGDDRGEQIAKWLDRISAMYSAKSFGTHSAGGTCKGLVPVRLESFRKALLSFATSLPETHEYLVFYLVAPARIITLKSPILRQVFSAVKRVHKACPQLQVHFHFVPEAMVTGGLDGPTTGYSDLEACVDAVYDRVMRPVERVKSREFYPHSGKIRAYFQDPAFALCRHSPGRVKFLMESHVTSLDVVDRYSILHVGYQVTPCRKWVLAACVDERGESHDLGVWLVPDDANETFVVTKVWSFALAMASKADVEWRMAITKLGTIGESEIDAWTSHLETALPMDRDSPSVQVTILSAEQDNPWVLLSSEHATTSRRPTSPIRTSKNSQGSVFADVSSTTYAILPSSRLAPFKHGTRELSSDLQFIPDVEDDSACDAFDVSPLTTATLVRVPAGTDHASISMLHLHLMHSERYPHLSLITDNDQTLQDVTKNFYDLTVLTKARWKLRANPILPFHLAALEVMYMGLDRGDATVDS